MNVILLGAPGSGKGTQAECLSRLLQRPHVATGDILREAVRQKTSLGEKVGVYMSAGALVPDDLIIELMLERLVEPDCQKGCIMDGFPRTLAQAKALDKLFQKRGFRIDRAVNLKVPRDVLIVRVGGRARQDDANDVIVKRLQVYEDQTSPLIGYYEQQGKLFEVNGIGTVDEITQRILAGLKA